MSFIMLQTICVCARVCYWYRTGSQALGKDIDVTANLVPVQSEYQQGAKSCPRT